MSTEHIIYSGGVPPSIVLDATCTRCYRVYRYEAPLTGVINQLLTDEGWRFPGIQQICPGCIGEEQAAKAVDEGPIGQV